MASVRIFSLICSAFVLFSSGMLNKAFAQDVFSGCGCVTEPGSYSHGVGQIVFASGEVLINNAGTSPGQILTASSEIMVGTGSVTFSVGASCSNKVGANTIVSISQPAGPGGDLCVRASSMDFDPPVVANSDLNLGGIALLGAGLAGTAILLLTLDGENNERKPASL